MQVVFGQVRTVETLKILENRPLKQFLRGCAEAGKVWTAERLGVWRSSGDHLVHHMDASPTQVHWFPILSVVGTSWKSALYI